MKILQVLQLPDDIREFAELAQLDGHLNISRLISEYESGHNQFRKPGEALFASRAANDELVAIGGVNIEPYIQAESTGRVRRLYVHPEFRRLGVGIELMSAIESHASNFFSTLQLYTSSAIASTFYVSLGYDLDQSSEKVSHVKCLHQEKKQYQLPPNW